MLVGSFTEWSYAPDKLGLVMEKSFKMPKGRSEEEGQTIQWHKKGQTMIYNDKGYSRNTWCTLYLMSTFVL